MSDFLLVVPAGWTQLDWEFISNNCAGLSTTDVRNGIVSDVENNLKAAGIIPEASSLIEFKLIDDTYLLVRLG